MSEDKFNNLLKKDDPSGFRDHNEYITISVSAKIDMCADSSSPHIPEGISRKKLEVKVKRSKRVTYRIRTVIITLAMTIVANENPKA